MDSLDLSHQLSVTGTLYCPLDHADDPVGRGPSQATAPGLCCLVRDLCACRDVGREFVVVILVDSNRTAHDGRERIILAGRARFKSDATLPRSRLYGH